MHSADDMIALQIGHLVIESARKAARIAALEDMVKQLSADPPAPMPEPPPPPPVE